MSAFLDALKAAPNTSRAKVNEFLASFNPRTRKIGIFVEGRDDPSFIRVHVARIANSLNLEVTTIVLGNKKEVLSAWEFLEERFPNNPKLMFFVDKDHDDLVGNTGSVTQQGLFVTSYYSIESFLVCTNTVKIVLTDFWGLDSSNGAIEVACKSFEKFQQAYRDVFLPWMAWILVINRTDGDVVNNSNNIPFTILTLNSNYEPILRWEPDMFTYLSNICKVEVPPNTADIDLAIKELELLPTKIWLRGKQELWCLIVFLKKLEEQITDNLDLKSANKSIKIRTKIEVSNAAEILSPRIPCPKELNDFVSNRLESL